MERDSGGAAGRLPALVAEIEAAAYARGRADARRDILALLGAEEKPAPARSSRGPRAGGGKRAPRGSARALVERALRDRPGLTAREVLDNAGTDGERPVKLGSIRAELQTGRRQGRYESEDGRWSLAAASPESDDTAGAPADPALSEAGLSPKPDDAAGAPTGDTPREDAAPGEPETGANRDRLGMNW